MPLTSSTLDDISYTSFEGMKFGMQDGNKRVLCIVSTEALEDRVALDQLAETPRETFARLRSEVEALASEKYDADSINPRVTSDDLARK